MTGEQPITLADRFDDFVLGGVARLKRRNYNPTQFLGMVHRHGGSVQATRVLLADPRSTSYGFQRLLEMDELRSSVEFAVCLPWFCGLFTEREVEIARFRLRAHGFPLDDELSAAAAHPPGWLNN